MDLPYFQVDAFTSRLFSGNPAGVCLLETWLPDETLQAIAAENNQAETAFVVPLNGGFQLRWFTPALEVDLCGHATLAAAHVLFRHRGLEGDEVKFATRSGELGVTRHGELFSLDFPLMEASACDVPAALVKGLGKFPAFTAKSSRDFLAVYETEEEVQALKPDFVELGRLDTLGVIATAPGMECDFVSRFFAPRAGVNEDPVTGSAHCTLAPYWAGQIGRNDLTARQVSSRGGELSCRIREGRVIITGRAKTYLTGTIHLATARKAWLAGEPA
ncbi:PhzF family phenazine biosynthesis protein [Haloferula sp. BvORR071]|uniref:PhzF family phenazine biosynthesis protein n=1 Tax=Haloferula sp. BvORR071 TaxID=1396141 RepID=UPI000698B81D|nr:PhzF family phenazine biosynthesis protein [Haloferula sp. BvORR071]